MKRLHEKSLAHLEAQGASLLDLRLPHTGDLKLIIYPGTCAAVEVRQLVQNIADASDEPIAMVQSDTIRKRRLPSRTHFTASETVIPTSKVRLVKTHYGVNSSFSEFPAVLEKMWGLLAIGVVVVRPSLQIAFMNDTAMHILEQQKIIGSNMWGRFLRGQSQTVQNIAGSLRKQRLLCFEMQHGGRTWQTTTLPISCDYVAVFMFCCMLSDNDCMVLSERYGLTAAETRLAAQFVKTPDTSDMAAHLHVSVATIRTTMRSVYEKTGARNQQGLMQLLLATSTVSFSDGIKTNS
ncbi:MAG: helix-turn-helix transcriptional regulator [Candidatus Porifericomitaceae bacterium WSBS_2022_MAG_OTU9]